MQEYDIILTQEAIYDIADIAEYIEARFGIKRADCFQQDIKDQLKRLSMTGGTFGNTHIFYRSYVVYKQPFPPSIIFYIIKKPELEIHILRILREERNWKTILSERQTYTYL